jgi:hypothetical protein
MTNPLAVAEIEQECQALFSELAGLQKKIRENLAVHADGKNLKGNELVGWLGEIYGKLLFDGALVDDREEHDFVSKNGLRVSVKTRKGWNLGWRQTSGIPRIEGVDCPTHLLFVHLNDDYSIDRMWLLEWQQLLDANRFKKHMVRGSQRSFIFAIDENRDQGCVVYGVRRQRTVPADGTQLPLGANMKVRSSPPRQEPAMEEFTRRGDAIRRLAGDLVLDYLRNHTDARPDGVGLTQTKIFRACGFDWGEYPKATSGNQQYWIVAALNDLQASGSVTQVRERGPWRLVR